MLRHLQFNKLIAVLIAFVFTMNSTAQSNFPKNEGDRARYNVQIDFKKAYISGICMMLMDEGVVKASVVNEFGVSALDFTYNPSKQKVKIRSVMGKMNRWYIKRVLKRDLKHMMLLLPQGQTTYEDKKYSIKYTFSPFDETQR